MSDKHTKKECQALIDEKKLPYRIVRIVQIDRLVSNDRDVLGRFLFSAPIYSWNRLFKLLSDMKSTVT